MRLTTSPLALAAGALFAVTAAIDIPHAQPDDFAGAMDYVLEAVFCLSMLASVAATWTLLRSAASRPARTGWGVLGTGYTLLTFVTGATAASGGNVLGPVFGLGLLALVVGSLLLAGTDLAGRVTPRGAGLVTLVGLVAMVALGDGYGVLAWSAVWFAVAALSRPGAQLPSTSRDLIRSSSAS